MLFGNARLEEELETVKEVNDRLRRRVAELERQVNFQNEDNDQKLQRMQFDHQMANEKKELEWSFADNELISKLEVEKGELIRENAVLRERNTMLDKMVDLNADIIDVKDLVKNLIQKLPEINIKGVTVQAQQK